LVRFIRRERIASPGASVARTVTAVIGARLGGYLSCGTGAAYPPFEGEEMVDLDEQIRWLASEIQAVEQMLVEAYGLTPVMPAIATGIGPTWARRLRSWYRRACQPLALFPESGMLAVRAPQPD
jgi:hypothetical protein